jgi:predicted nucleic acid-binding Zn ribbon protein
MNFTRDFEPLNALLSQWFEQRNQHPKRSEVLPQNLAATWAQIVGPALAHRSRPVKLMGHTLSIEVSSEAWGQALAEQKQFLLHQLKARLPRLSIRDIQFSAQGLLLPPKPLSCL